MQHAEFVHAHKTGTIAVDVDRKKALQVANAWEKLPYQFRSAHVFWSAAWLLTLPVALAAAFLHSWWAGTLILLVLMPTLYAATKKSAALHVLDYAIESSVFYEYAVEHGIISIRQKP
jgi:hypothetical protein